MISKDETYKRAFELKKSSLLKKQSEYSMYIAAAYASNPRLGEIDALLSKCGAALALDALAGDTTHIEQIHCESTALSSEKQALLAKSGLHNIEFDCPLCSDTGYVGGKICSCVKELAKQIMLSSLNEEMPLDDCRFDNFNLKYYSDKVASDGTNPQKRMSGILELCKNYALDFDPKKSANLLFFGSAGLGKTHLTLAIISEIIKKGYMPVYGSAQNLFNAVEKEHFSNTGGDSLDAMLSCDLLAIDDLGTEFATSFTKSVLYNLVNTRLLSHKPTIINTNISIKELEKLYTPRITSRLIGNYDSRKFLGNDIRQILNLSH